MHIYAFSGKHTRASVRQQCAEGSEMGFFPKTYADIGDMQDLAKDLSSFSAHLTKIIELLDIGVSQEKQSSAQRYLKKNADLLQVNEKDLDGLVLSSISPAGKGTYEIAYLKQTKGGINIHNRIINVVFDKSGKAVDFKGTLANNLDRTNIATSPSISAESGLTSAAKHLKLEH